MGMAEKRFRMNKLMRGGGRKMWNNIKGTLTSPTGEAIERLSHSHYSLKDIVLEAQVNNSKAFAVATHPEEALGKHHYSSASIETLVKELQSDSNNGLTSAQVNEIRKRYGPNVLEKQQRESWLRVFLSNFRSGVVLLLMIAAIVSMSFKEWYEGSVIFLIVFCNSALATHMEISAGNAINRLANLTAPKCKVIRNGGQTQEIDTVDVVPGDIVMLCTGDVLPADLRCISVNELEVNEAILTGESTHVRKALNIEEEENAFPSNLCFASTSVTSGSGVGLIYATGMNTEIGKIAGHLVRASRKKQLTPLQRALNRLSGFIAMISIVVLLLIVVIAILTRYKDPSHTRSDQFLDIFLVAVGFCVSSIPEGLPMIVTICLALGCKDIAKKNGSIRKLTAVETLGSCSVICSDKTGTLTEGKMTCIKKFFFCRGLKLNINGHSVKGSDSFLSKDANIAKNFGFPVLFHPTNGLSPYGDVFLKNDFIDNIQGEVECDKKEHLNSFDAGEYTSILQREDTDPVKLICTTMALAGFLNCSEAVLYWNKDENLWKARGNTSEAAILVAAAKCGWATDEVLLSQKKCVDPTLQYPQLNRLRIPFTSTRKMMCTIHSLHIPNCFHGIRLNESKNDVDPAIPKFKYIAILKGAPERLIYSAQRCLTVSAENTVYIDWSDAKLQSTEVEALAQSNMSMAQHGLRILALALVPLSDEVVERDLEACRSADERLEIILQLDRLTVLGLYGSVDPPRRGVAESVKTCHKAGIRVVMITGDQSCTASTIAADIGILDFPLNLSSDIITVINHSQKQYTQSRTTTNFKGRSRVLLCSDLHVNGLYYEKYLNEYELDRLVNETLVFSRAQPQDKLVIVESLKRLGHVVAMTGDGVNDAPALQSADIGVAMGITGTDVAKGASELVLLDDNFSTIVTSISEGRRIYGNIQKFVSFLLGTNIGEIVYLSVAIACGLKMPVESLQILFLNLMSDGCPAVALTREPADADSMNKPPRNRNEGIMTRDWWIYSNIPHIIFEAFCVLACLILSTYLSTGALTIKDINNQCYSENDIKYYCQTSSFLFSNRHTALNGSGFYVSIDYWDPNDKSFHHKPYAYYGRMSKTQLFPKDFENVQGCGKNENMWCVPESKSEVPDDYLWVNARQTRIASTQTFITAVYCEMLRAYSISTWNFFLFAFKRNPWMHLGCFISAVCTVLVTIIPGVNNILNLHPLPLWQYALSIAWAVLSLALDEGIAKPLYRRHLSRQKL